MTLSPPLPKFSALHAPAFRSPGGTAYVKEPGVVLIAQPAVNIDGLGEFLGQFDAALKFRDYLDDPRDMLTPGTHLCKTAGQTCYCSWGEKRTKNAEAQKYLMNIIQSGHGSVLEHANYTLFLYGISRSLTHELVRHRAGFAYSQVSQRYVDDTTLRFVMRPEYDGDPELEQRFFENIDRAAKQYREITDSLMNRQAQGSQILSGEKKRDERKKRQQAAREVLPNSTEAPITVTAHIRAWRHTLEMRASDHAETEIRRLFMKIYRVLVQVEPIMFGDYEVVKLPDGTECLRTEHRKV